MTRYCWPISWWLDWLRASASNPRPPPCAGLGNGASVLVMIRVELLICGSTHQRGRLAGTTPGRIEFPSLVALLRHPKHGIILFDTGHSTHITKQLTRIWEKGYLKLLPSKMSPERSAARQLAARGIQPKELSRIIVSHYHADHIGGLRDFRNARFMQGRQLPPLPGRHASLSQAKSGFFPQLLPKDYPVRVDWVANLHQADPGPLGEFAKVFPRSYDLLNDGSVILVPLPGHDKDQIGCYLPATERGDGRPGPPLFLTADSSWTIDAITDNKLPPRPVLALTGQVDEYRRTIAQISRFAKLRPEALIVPSHSATAIADAKRKLA